jgi:CAAX protease family protein
MLRTNGTPATAGWGHIGLVLALAFAQAAWIFVLGVGVIMPALLGDRLALSGAPREAAVLGALALPQFALVLLAVRLSGTTLRAVGWTRHHLGRDLALGVAGAAAGVALTAGVVASMGPEAFADFGRTLAETTVASRLAYLFLGLGAAFAEETTFRGLLQPALVAKAGPWLGIALGAVAFALYHLNLRPVPFANRFLLGLVFGTLARATGSLVAPAAAHALVWAALGPA